MLGICVSVLGTFVSKMLVYPEGSTVVVNDGDAEELVRNEGTVMSVSGRVVAGSDVSIVAVSVIDTATVMVEGKVGVEAALGRASVVSSAGVVVLCIFDRFWGFRFGAASSSPSAAASASTSAVALFLRFPFLPVIGVSALGMSTGSRLMYMSGVALSSLSSSTSRSMLAVLFLLPFLLVVGVFPLSASTSKSSRLGFTSAAPKSSFSNPVSSPPFLPGRPKICWLISSLAI